MNDQSLISGRQERPAQPRATRFDWIDAARGAGILLVVYGHVMRGLVRAGMIPDTLAFRVPDTMIYAFHMPLFFVISGLLSRPVASGRRWSFLGGRAEALLYPYFLWSIVQGLLTIAMNGVVNRPLEWAELMGIGWAPIGQFWFLYALFLVNLTLLLPKRFHLFPIAVALATVLGLLFSRGPILVRACYDLLFFAMGVWITAPRLTRWLDDRRTAFLVALISWALLALIFLYRIDPATGFWNGDNRGWDYLCGFLGTFGTFALARLAVGWVKPLCLIGQASMAIYVLHAIVSAGARIAIQKLALPLPDALLVTVLVLAGTLVPYAVYRVASRMGAERLLGLGRSPRGFARLADCGARA